MAVKMTKYDISVSPDHINLSTDPLSVSTDPLKLSVDHQVSSSTQEDVLRLPLFEAAEVAWRVGIPFLIILGTIGNVLIIVVICRSKLMPWKMASYLVVMAVSDLLGLYLSVTMKWLQHHYDGGSWYLHKSLCKMATWMLHSSKTGSTWTLVVMVTQQTLTLLWPHRLHPMFTPKAVRLLLSGLVTVALALNAQFLYCSTVVDVRVNEGVILKQCRESYDEVAASTSLVVHSVMAHCLPVVILLVDDVVLVARIVTSRRLPASRGEEHTVARGVKTSSMTLTSLYTSLAFVLLSSPYEALRMAKVFLRKQILADAATVELFYFASSICTLLWCSNCAVNFYLYLLARSRFRTKMAHILCACKRKIFTTLAFHSNKTVSEDRSTLVGDTESQ